MHRWLQTKTSPDCRTTARYHNVYVDDAFPNARSKKEELQNWLTRNDHAWHSDMLKSELLEKCVRWSPAPEFKLDRLTASKGISILRTPPYHPELQPIETCWAVVKNHMADNCDFTMKGLLETLPEAFTKVTAETCRKIMNDIKIQEDKFWREDEKLDDVYAADAMDDRLAGAENEGVESYLGES